MLDQPLHNQNSSLESIASTGYGSLNLKIAQLLQNPYIMGLVMALAYCLAAKIGRCFAMLHSNVTPLWPPSGLALAALYSGRKGILPGVFLGCFFSSVDLNIPPVVHTVTLDLWIAASVTSTTYVGFWVIKKFSSDTYPFNTFHDVMIFIFGAAGASCLISATMGTLGLLVENLIPVENFTETWFTWWLGDTVGAITVGSSLIVWLEKKRWDISFLKIFEAILLLIITFAIYIIMYKMHYKVLYIILLIFILSVYHLGTQLSLSLAVIFTIFIISGHVMGHSVFSDCPPNVCMLLMQLFVCSVFTTILILTALISERKRAFFTLKMVNDELEQRVTERNEKNKSLQQEIEKTELLSKQLVELAHRAGKSEVANSVLHNAGNVLNSVNVSILLLLEKLSKSKIEGLVKAANLLKDNAHDIHHFLIEDDRGQYWPAYIYEVTACLEQEYKEYLTLVQTLRDRTDHIKQIIRSQEVFSGKTLIEEKVSIKDLCDEAIKLSNVEDKTLKIILIRAYDGTQIIYVDKHKVLQILVNFLVNARDTLQDKLGDRNIIVSYKDLKNEFIQIQVTDDGMGIDHEKLQKIFTYGFTTKKKGNGIGLHSSANLAQEMGGKIDAKSDGIGKGSTFTLCLKAVYTKTL